MEKTNNHGGKREGSGRKSDKEILNLRGLLDDSIDSEFVVKQLFNMIDTGDYRAIELYMKYRFGVPTKQIEMSVDTAQDINFHLEDVLKFKKQ